MVIISSISWLVRCSGDALIAQQEVSFAPGWLVFHPASCA